MNSPFVIKRLLHKIWKCRFQPSIYRCITCGKYVKRGVKHDHPSTIPASFYIGIKGFGYRKPGRKQRRQIAEVPSIRKYLPRRMKALPPTYDLRNVGGVDYTMPGFDQDGEGMCTGPGAAGMTCSHEKLNDTFQEVPSKRFPYNNARHRGGLLPNQEGAYMIDVMNGLLEDGICREHYWDSTPNGPTHDDWPPPNPDALVDARNWRIEWFANCADETDPETIIKQAIYEFGAIDMGTPWTASWETPWNGDCPLPPDNDEVLGGHSWVIIGWDDIKGRFIARNSWGTLWGNKGDFTFPYATLTCKAWKNAGGYEAYKAKDAESHICPEGQHWDGTVCVDDGSEPPEPSNCEEEDMNCTMGCVNAATDFFTMLFCALNCLMNYFVCKFSLAKFNSMTSKALGKKTQVTKSMSFPKVGVTLSVTLKKMKK